MGAASGGREGQGSKQESGQGAEEPFMHAAAPILLKDFVQMRLFHAIRPTHPHNMIYYTAKAQTPTTPAGKKTQISLALPDGLDALPGGGRGVFPRQDKIFWRGAAGLGGPL